MKAILYSRWSSQEQSHGSTLQRQTEINESLCRLRGWEIAESLCDRGLSAWTGENLRTGNLGKLTTRLERDGGEGVVIVVEKLDRLSRQPPLIMTNWMQRICATGAVVASGDGRHTIDQASLMTNPMGIMAIIYEAFVAFEESKKKSDRGLENWRMKRESGKPLTRQCPAWLRLSDDRTHYLTVPERVEIVQRIFRLQDAGTGKYTIANLLNAEGIEPWGNGARKGTKWHASYVSKIIQNAAVLGDHQHGQKQRSDSKRTLVGEVVKNYYPAIIDEALFARVNDHRKQQVMRHQKRGTIANLFTGLTRCTCGAIMTFRAKGKSIRADGSVVREDYLVCDAAIRPGTKGTCNHRTSYNYSRFRDAVLDHLLHRALDDGFFRAPDSLAEFETSVATKARAANELERRMAGAFLMIEEDPSDAHARVRYRTLKNEHRAALGALEAAEKGLKDAQGAVSPAEHLARVSDVRALLDSPDDALRNAARARVKQALNELIAMCEFDGAKQRAIVRLVAGLGVLFVQRDGTAAWFDLSKPDRDVNDLSADDIATVQGFIRRKAGEDAFSGTVALDMAEIIGAMTGGKVKRSCG